jgi:hypothetical protein
MNNEDPIHDFIVRKKLPQTRQTYLSLLYLDGEEPQELEAELEASLPDYARAQPQE